MFLRALGFAGTVVVAVVCLLLEAALAVAEFRYVQLNGWLGLLIHDPVDAVLSAVATFILVGAAIVVPVMAWPWKPKKDK